MTEKYWAAEKDPAKVAREICDRADRVSPDIQRDHRYERIRSCYANYYGYSHNGNSFQITPGGDRGELSHVYVNQVRNLTQHLLALVSSKRLSYEVQPVNNDIEARESATITDGLLRSAVRKLRVDRKLRMATEYALVTGEGYARVDWDPQAGEEMVADEKGGVVREGDARVTVYGALDVVRDNYLRSEDDRQWLAVRDLVNRFDLVAQFPELEKEILSVAPDDYRSDWFVGDTYTHVYSEENRDLIPVYSFYHERTPALPGGRETLLLPNGKWLTDGPLSYPRIPVYRISPADILQTPHGYSTVWDLLGPNEAYNALLSTALSNQLATGVQNVLVPRGSNLKPHQLVGGLNVLEYDPKMGKPETLQLTDTPAEVFKSIDMWDRISERQLNVSPISRGEIPDRVSGSLAALVDARSLEFNSVLQESYVHLAESVGRGIKEVYQSRVQAPRTVALVGKNNRHMLRSFVGKDLSKADLVTISLGNPYTSTSAGQLELAVNMMQSGLLKQPEQLYDVINTGKTESVLQGPRSEMNLIAEENEQLSQGIPVQVLATDNHLLHIQEHRQVSASPEARQNPAIMQAHLAHMQQHLDMLRTLPPDMLQALGQMPSQLNQQAIAAQRGTPDPGAPNPEAEQMPEQPDLPTPAQPPSPQGGQPPPQQQQ